MAINFSQVRALQIQNEAYRQLEYINLKNSNYFNLGSTSQGLYREFDINVGVPTGATSYPFFGYSVDGYGKSINIISIMRSGASFTYGRRDDATVAYADIYSGTLMHNKRRIVKAYVRDDKKSVIEIYDTEGTLLDSDTSKKVYVNQPYASSNTGLFAAWIYRDSDDETKFRPCIEPGQSGIFYSYKARASADGPLLENWLPAQRKADGAIGIYDTVNHRFLQPFLTDSRYLTAGPVFDENPQWSPLVKVKQIKNASNVVLWTAAPELTSITLAGYNTSLNINSNFLYGGTVTANYSDGSTADVTLNTTFTGYDMSTAGTQTVTASYTEHGITKTATYQLTVVSGPAWHTIWEGTQRIQMSGGTVTGTVNNFASTAAGTGNRPQVRITVTTTNSGSGTREYALNGSSYYYTYSSSAISNPYTVTLASANSTYIISLKNSHYGYTTYLNLMKDYNATDDNVNFSLTRTGTTNSDGYVVMTITKIEQYY